MSGVSSCIRRPCNVIDLDSFTAFVGFLERHATEWGIKMMQRSRPPLLATAASAPMCYKPCSPTSLQPGVRKQRQSESSASMRMRKTLQFSAPSKQLPKLGSALLLAMWQHALLTAHMPQNNSYHTAVASRQ